MDRPCRQKKIMFYEDLPILRVHVGCRCVGCSVMYIAAIPLDKLDGMRMIVVIAQHL
jgi:hypothetical protein